MRKTTSLFVGGLALVFSGCAHQKDRFSTDFKHSNGIIEAGVRVDYSDARNWCKDTVKSTYINGSDYYKKARKKIDPIARGIVDYVKEKKDRLLGNSQVQ